MRFQLPMKTYLQNLFTRRGGASCVVWVLPALIAGLGLIPAGRVNAASPGTVVAWGNNDYGQTNVSASLNGVVTAIATSSIHNVALKSDGTVVAWGNNSRSEE